MPYYDRPTEVLIKSAKNKQIWYASKIGRVFEVYKRPDPFTGKPAYRLEGMYLWIDLNDAVPVKK
jgi:hypothetical protein